MTVTLFFSISSVQEMILEGQDFVEVNNIPNSEVLKIAIRISEMIRERWSVYQDELDNADGNSEGIEMIRTETLIDSIKKKRLEWF